MRRLAVLFLVFAACKPPSSPPPASDDDDDDTTATPAPSPTPTLPGDGGYPTGLSYPALPDPPASGPAPAPASGVRTFYQTNGAWDARLAVPADMVVVSAHGADAGYVSSTLGSWASHGFPTGRMFQANADGGVLYTGGDPGHPEIERDKNGNALGVDDRPYITPSDGWRTFLEGQADIGIAGGAGTVLVEEALLHQRGGYDARFKTAWQSHYGSAWADPTASPANRWKANKLRSKLTSDLMRDLAAHSHAAGRAHWYADHSLASFGATGLVFPYARALLSSEPDAFVAQVWTWPVKLVLEGQGEACSAGAGHGDCQFFEAAWMLYSHWIELARGGDVPVYLLADPVDDDASQSIDEYREWWREIVVAGMSFPEASRFEVMPWPERIFLAGGIGGGAPEDYRQELLAVFEAQRQISDAPDWWSSAPDSRLGVVAGDTMIWQDPSVFPVPPAEIALQLARKGVPAPVVPAERLVDPAYRARFTTLVVSYDGWKPETAAQNQALADFALEGGVLLVLARGDEFDSIGEWWGSSALADLLGRVGFQASASGQKDPGAAEVTLAPAVDTPLAGAAGTITVPRAPIGQFTAWTQTGAARTFLPTGSDVRVLYSAGDAPVILDQVTGQGAVVLAGISARDLMWDANGATLAFALARYAGEGWGHRPVRERGYWWTRRGDWHLVSSRTASPALTGKFVDHLDPALPLLTNPAPPANRVRIYRQVDALVTGTTPRILASNQRLANIAESATATSFRARGPAETTAVIRMARNGRTPAPPPPGVTLTVEGETVKLTFAGAPDGRDVSIGWN